MSILGAIFMEAFVSIHMSLFVLSPLSKIISKDNSKKTFWILFGIRAGILLFFDIFITPGIAILDFYAVFIGAFIIVPISAKVTGTPINARSNKVINSNITNGNIANNSVGNVILKCTKCGATLQVNDKVCPSCGTPFDGNNVQVIEDKSPIVTFDASYSLKEKKILKNMIMDEFKANGDNPKTFTTTKLLKKNYILLAILGVLTLITTILFYFNYSFIVCLVIEVLILIMYIVLNKKFNVINILTKEAVKKPDEDISKLVRDIKNEKQETMLPSYLKIIIVIFVGVFIPTVVFFNPRILYTRYGDGYQVFRYTRGIISNEEVIVPENYNGKSVLAIGERAFKNTKIKKVSLPDSIESIKYEAFRGASNIESIDVPQAVEEIRANAFADMSSLKYLSLPEGLKDIRAGAFANDINLTNVTLPSTLEYLGASAFSHCSSITEVVIPKKVTEINGQTFEYMTSLKYVGLHDDITYIHGEVFRGDIYLDNIILPSKITEIKGSTFEDCSSLSSIRIPEGVTRIGGHAFYGCSSLSYVEMPRSIREIGSSAFRRCNLLKRITIPRNTVVNERAFKESPTIIDYYTY